jgi:hypothetical protein
MCTYKHCKLTFNSVEELVSRDTDLVEAHRDAV